MLKIVSSKKNPRVLIITPLKNGEKISSVTRTTIQRNKTPYIWISYESDKSRSAVLNMVLEEYRKSKMLPEYILPLDFNMKLGRFYIDRLIEKLDNVSDFPYGYAYGTLVCLGKKDIIIKAIPFDISTLLRHNYISNNSMFRSNILNSIPFIEDEGLVGLEMWAYELLLIRHGIIGINVPEASHSSPVVIEENGLFGCDISAEKAYQNITKNFITPLLNDIKKIQESNKKSIEDKPPDTVTLI